MDTKLREAFRFHLEWGGYCTPPGRAACALASARAELTGEQAGVTFEWINDDDPDTSWLDQEGWEKARRDYQDGKLLILGCIARLGDRETSLWGISVYSSDDPYCRSVQADLAGELLWEIERAAGRSPIREKP